MDTLQKLFEIEIQKHFTFPVVGAKLIKRQLEKKGVLLNETQTKKLEDKLQVISSDTLSFEFDFDDEQSHTLDISDGQKVVLDISDPETDLDDIYQEFVDKLENSIPEIIDQMALPILSGLKRKAPAMLKEHRKERRNFEHRLNNDWEKPFDLFEMFLVIAFEAGDEFNKEFRKEGTKDNFVCEVLIRLHARACQIASEILVLLKSGYADGAHARWRSLHEIAVVGSFIKINGNEIAERYLLHNNIESYKAATLYQKYCEALGNEPIHQEEFDSMQAGCEKLIKRFGSSYKNDYGWAASVLGKDKPTFCDIEEKSGLDHLRPYYKMASHNVHANPKGVMFKLGLHPDTQNILLAGPSNWGFTDPAQGAAISLGLITVTLLTTKPTIDNLVLSRVLQVLESEIGEEFFRVQQVIESRSVTQ